MKPVDQSTFGVPTGNCLSACIASLLNLPIEEVPHFGDVGQYEALTAWLAPRGMYPVCFPIAAEDAGPSGLHLVGGQSARGSHVVIGRGSIMVHDPHPSRAGLVVREDVTILVSADPGAAELGKDGGT